MNLKPVERQFANWTVSGAPAGATVEVSFGGAYLALTRPDEFSARILVAGPTATGNPVGTTVLVSGRNVATIRVTDIDEVVYRPAGVITVRA